MTRRAYTLLCLVLTLATFSRAEERNKTWTDPEKASAEDPDFLIQGEYGVDQLGQAWGVQVVALGNGQFDAYVLKGGLPGIGWDKSKERTPLKGAREGKVVVFGATEQGLNARISKQGRFVLRQGKKRLARLKRIERKSPTLGAEAPSGATILFDGSSADAWDKGRINNGLLANNDISTKQKFGSYQLHMEFRTPYKPFARGQGRGNSGVYHQGRFETQVLDSFGLEGKMNETGGVYSIADPLINACLPPLAWQTYDVDFTAAQYDASGNKTGNPRMTVKLNGIVVQNDLELPHSTTASPLQGITEEKGPIFIQHHGNPVYYRNIWIVEKD